MMGMLVSNTATNATMERGMAAIAASINPEASAAADEATASKKHGTYTFQFARNNETHCVTSTDNAETLDALRKRCKEDRVCKVFRLKKEEKNAMKAKKKAYRVEVGQDTNWVTSWDNLKALTIGDLLAGLPSNKRANPVPLKFELIDLASADGSEDENDCD